MKGLRITLWIMIECLDVLLHTLTKAARNKKTKAATNTGMSDSVYDFCSNTLGFFFLLTCIFIIYRKRTYPQIPYDVIGKLFLVGLFSCIADQIVKYFGIDHSSPTLATVISSLTPGFAFIIAIISRMEVFEFRMNSSQAKSTIGTVISLAGALIATLYKGIPLTSAFLNQLLLSIRFKWVIGGFILLLQSFSGAFNFVVQTMVMKEYSDELIKKLPAGHGAMSEYLEEVMANLFCCFSETIISAPVALIDMRSNPDAWQIKSNVVYIAIGLNAVIAVPNRKALRSGAVRKKCPICFAMLLRIVIEFIFGIIFLGETIYLGRLIGMAIVTGGFCSAVICGEAQEEESVVEICREAQEEGHVVEICGEAQEEDNVVENSQLDTIDNSSSHIVPLLQNQNTAKWNRLQRRSFFSFF